MRQDGTDDDAVPTLAIAAARAKAENYTGTAIISQTWEQTLDEFPDAEIELLKPPVTAVTSVSYVDGRAPSGRCRLVLLARQHHLPGLALARIRRRVIYHARPANAVTIHTPQATPMRMRCPATCARGCC